MHFPGAIWSCNELHISCAITVTISLELVRAVAQLRRAVECHTRGVFVEVVALLVVDTRFADVPGSKALAPLFLMFIGDTN